MPAVHLIEDSLASFHVSNKGKLSPARTCNKGTKENCPVLPVTKEQRVTVLSCQDVSGLPWWGTILISTALLRTAVTLPAHVTQQKVNGLLGLMALMTLMVLMVLLVLLVLLVLMVLVVLVVLVVLMGLMVLMVSLSSHCLLILKPPLSRWPPRG